MWARLGDTSAFHPLPLNVLEHPDTDDRLLNEAMGFFYRCATQAAAHLTDYVITRGTAITIGGATRGPALLEVCVFAGLMEEKPQDGGDVVTYKLFDGDPDFLHLRLKREIDWERQRKSDASRPSLIVPVRLRDGDACRWCGHVVDWQDRKSGRAGTYDHLLPGEPASVDTYVVSCKKCNSSRQAGDLPQGVVALLDPPSTPIFSAYSIKFLTENRWRIDQGLRVPEATAPEAIETYARGARSQPARTTPSSSPQPAGDAPTVQQPQARQTESGAAAQSAHPRTTTLSSPQPAGDTPTVQQPQARQTGSGAAAQSAHPESRGPAAAGAVPEQTPTPPPRGQASADRAADGAGPNGQLGPPGGPDPAGVGPPDRPPSTPPADLTDIHRYQLDSADRRGTGPIEAGRVGSGRAGSGLVVSPSQPPASPVHPSETDSPRRRGRRGRGRR